MAGNDDLHKPLKAINRTIARLREDIQNLTGEVTKIHSIIREAAESIQDVIHENTQAQAELKVLDYRMEMQSVKPQIEAEHEQIQTEDSELDERLSSIGQRYRDKHEEFDRTAAERIRDLGSHIFAIDEEEFREGIEDPFTEHVTPTWKTLQQHNEGVRDDRRMAIGTAAGDTARRINAFIDRQEALMGAIENHRFDPEQIHVPAGGRTVRLQAPYYVVRYEQNGVTERNVVVPSRLEPATDDEWCSMELSALDGATELLNGVSGVDVETADRETISADTITEELSKHGKTTLLGQSYAREARKTLPEELPVRVAGGDE